MCSCLVIQTSAVSAVFKMRTFSYGDLERDSAKQSYFCFPTAIQSSLGNTTRYYNKINSILLYYINTLLYLNSNQLCAHFKSLTSKIKVYKQKLFCCEILRSFDNRINSRSIEFEYLFSNLVIQLDAITKLFNIQL